MTEQYSVGEGDAEEYPPAPFSFKLMIVLVVLYLGWRLVQGVIWLWERIF